MDILSLDTEKACSESIEFELLSPVDQKGTGIFFSIVGKDSKINQDFIREQNDEIFRKAHRAKKRGKDDELMTMDKLSKRSIDTIVNCMTGWRQGEWSVDKKTKERILKNPKDTITFGSEELVFNEVNAKKLLKKLEWISDQTDGAIQDLSLFMKT